MQQRLLTVSAVRPCDATGEPSAPLVLDNNDAPDFAAGLGAFFRPLVARGSSFTIQDCSTVYSGSQERADDRKIRLSERYGVRYIRSDNPGLHLLEFLLLVADCCTS